MYASQPRQPTLDSLLEHIPIGFDLKDYFSSKPDALKKLITYGLSVPEPLLQNERQCYLYPSKATQMLCRDQVSSLLTLKVKECYPIFDYIFGYLELPKLPTNYCYLQKIVGKLIMGSPEVHKYLTLNPQLLERMVTQLDNPSVCSIICDLLQKDHTDVFISLKRQVIRCAILESVQRLDPEYFQSLEQIISTLKSEELKESICIPEFMSVIQVKIVSEDVKLSYYSIKICFTLLNLNPTIRPHLVQNINNLVQLFEQFQSQQGFNQKPIPVNILELAKLLALVSFDLPLEQSVQNVKRMLLYSSLFSNCTSLLLSASRLIQERMRVQNREELLESTQMVLFMSNLLSQGKCTNLVRRVVDSMSTYQQIAKYIVQLKISLTRRNHSVLNTVVSQESEVFQPKDPDSNASSPNE